jgi:hypothetical protein
MIFLSCKRELENVMTMKTNLALALSALMLITTLAGCLGGGVEQDENAPDPTPEPTRGSASISGRVLDPEFFPIADAKLVLAARKDVSYHVAQATSAEDGSYILENLGSGDFLLFATKPGFRDAAARAVTIGPSESKTIDITLDPLARHVPHHATLEGRFEWRHAVCRYVTPIEYSSCTTGIGLTNLSKIHYIQENESGPLAAIVAESSWEPTVSVCAESMRLDLASPQAKREDRAIMRANTTSPYMWNTIDQRRQNPIHLYVAVQGGGRNAVDEAWRVEKNNNSPLTIDGNWTLYTWLDEVGHFGTPVDVSCVVDQDVYYWHTVFFIAPPEDPKWSARPPA